MTAEHVREALRGRAHAARQPAVELAAGERSALAEMAEALVDDIVAGRRSPVPLPDIEAEFPDLGVAWQVAQALERRLAAGGGRRRGPTDEEARRWFGYSGASSWRRWLSAHRKR
jgi:hypothetical protein